MGSLPQAIQMLKPAVHQVAGHEAAAGQVGPLVDDSGKFYKPLQDKDRGQKEVEFYNKLWADKDVPDEVKSFFPLFYGTSCIEASDGSGPCDHAVLEDLTHDYHHPSVMDIKMGLRTWYPGASEKYIQKCLIKDTESTSGTIGFRVSGMQVYKAATGTTWKPNRNWCKQLTTDQVEFALKCFVSSNTGEDEDPDAAFGYCVYDGLNGVIDQLESLKKWFQTQTRYHFYSSSILLIYEGDSAASMLKDDTAGPPASFMPMVQMVDFAHVLHDQTTLDGNFLEGLKCLIWYLNQIVGQSPKNS